ncbi:hypothetical protein [uncultured Duncaniella sp.]|uniref:hypothetical protein n=1 Tax=uncultured Duncaniella sp. TaxID=2768039 RepID=UPI00260EAB45|nr:hypothetical protein [uncultured Duncaniella sp.]
MEESCKDEALIDKMEATLKSLYDEFIAAGLDETWFSYALVIASGSVLMEELTKKADQAKT